MAEKDQAVLDALNAQIASATAAADISGSQVSIIGASEATAHKKIWWSVDDAMTISPVVLVFGLSITLVAAWLVKSGVGHNAVLRVFGTILILVFSVFLVVAGYDDKQIAPVLGLLGTVAGYLLGRSERGDVTPRDREIPHLRIPRHSGSNAVRWPMLRMLYSKGQFPAMLCRMRSDP